MYGLHVVILLLLPMNVISDNSCIYSKTQGNPEPRRFVSINRKVMNVTLYWASDPARAASAIFAASLWKALNFENIILKESHDLDLQNWLTKVPSNDSTGQYDEVIIALSVAWEPHYVNVQQYKGEDGFGLAGPRLEVMGASSVPVQQRVHVHLANHFHNQSQCINFTQWSFYTNATTLEKCGFKYIDSSNDNMTNAIIYELESVNTRISKLKDFAKILRFAIKTKNRTEFFEILQSGNHSFLFVDYDVWSDHPRVTTMLHPYCLESKSTCLLETSAAVALRVGDVSNLLEYEPDLLKIAHDFSISAENIREILKLESQGKPINQVALDWVTENKSLLDWVKNVSYEARKRYDIIVCYCEDDPDFQEYDRLLNEVYKPAIRKISASMFTIELIRFEVNCTDVNDINSQLNTILSYMTRQRWMGAVVGSVGNINHVAKTLESLELPVLFYDAIGLVTSTKKLHRGDTWLATGGLTHLNLALRYFLKSMGWTRVAVISEPTETAQSFIDELKRPTEYGALALRDYLVKLNLSALDAQDVVKTLKEDNAHIILINTNYKDAATLLEAGASLGMNLTKDYAWILREWRPNPKTANIRHFTFSFWCRCGTDPSNTEGLPEIRQKIDEYYRNCTWPPHAATLGDALFTLANGFKDVILKCPGIRKDLRNNEAMELFKRSVNNAKIGGVTQNLKYNGYMLEEAAVFLDEWFGNHSNHLARFSVKSHTSEVFIYEQRAAYPKEDQPHDGSSKCFAPYNDPYLPNCYDLTWIISLILLFISIPTCIMAYRFVHHRLKEHEKQIICKVLAQRQLRAAALSDRFLVCRSDITLLRELDSNRSGYVRLALLRLPNKPPRHVAAKAVHDLEYGSEIVDEACVLASLEHEHIIRLIGVCIDINPPLLLTEIAFFGDLRQYLRDRRYLVMDTHFELTESTGNVEEVHHVSGIALTRLARQAASAVAYLAFQGVIHRNLRASNCVIDTNRTLKLTDFVLAREIKEMGFVVNTEYTSRRHGIFPVLWMAPESLTQGIFSTASDVWALGVLVFELVTLGARPYGTMSPLRVIQYVAEGSKLTMPQGATPQTIALTRLCWQREPGQRPTAADVMEYLADRPNALQPAFDDDIEEPTGDDSGCDKSKFSP